jgi:hypothetical protein
MSAASLEMPTDKERLTLNIPLELYKALEACAGRANRTLANQAAIALEEFLLKSGDLSSPVKLALQGRPRKNSKTATKNAELQSPNSGAVTEPESRGGRRGNAGRKPQVTGDNAVESIADDSTADADDN